MEVILLEKIANLGELGQVVKVKDGYARNFLIPHGKAKRATEENRKAFEAKRADLEKAQAATLAKAQERGKKLEGLTLQITQKAGPDGRLFGSVTNYDIVEALRQAGPRGRARQHPHAAGAAQAGGRFPDRDRAAHRRRGDDQGFGARRAVSFQRLQRRKGSSEPFLFCQRRAKALAHVNHNLPTGHPQPGAPQAPNSKRFLQRSCGKEYRRRKFIFLLPNEFAYDGGRGGKQKKWPWRNKARTLVRANRILIRSS